MPVTLRKWFNGMVSCKRKKDFHSRKKRPPKKPPLKKARVTSREEQLKAFDRLLDIMDELREKCPWDRKQTFETLRPLTIEETYELGDAILDHDLNEIRNELGDLLLHIVFYARLGAEKEAFDIGDVAHQIAEKLIYRHPHIYGDVTAEDEETVKKNWEKLKLKEGKKSIFSGVPKGLPALVKAQRLQHKAAGVGFDWENSQQVWNKVEEELEEFQVEVVKEDAQAMEQEFGDVLFALLNYARFKNIDADSALERTNKKFMERFRYMEERATAQGRAVSDITLAELEALWQESKA
jgi:XTP/dITP diphosphohydrolase